jgi:hypothetical protein
MGICDAFARSRSGKFVKTHYFSVFADPNANALNNVADFRKEYSQKGLIEEEVLSNPMDQFSIWFKEAVDSKVLEPNAMVSGDDS